MAKQTQAAVVAEALREKFAKEDTGKAGALRTAAVVKGLILVGHYVWDAKVYTVFEACAEFGIELLHQDGPCACRRCA